MDRDLYDLSDTELDEVPSVCASLEEALVALHSDHAFLLEGGVFTEDFIVAYTDLKLKELDRLRATPHPIEFEMYYSD